MTAEIKRSDDIRSFLTSGQVLDMPVPQRKRLEMIARDYLSGQASHETIDKVWEKLCLVERVGGRRTIEEQLWAKLIAFDETLF